MIGLAHFCCRHRYRLRQQALLSSAPLKLSGDEDSRAAAEAIEALSKLNKHVPLARYAPLATTGPDGVRVPAIRFLFRFNTDEASAVAATALESNSPAIRQEGAYALSRRAFAPAREKLELLMGDPNVNALIVVTRAFRSFSSGTENVMFGAPMPGALWRI